MYAVVHSARTPRCAGPVASYARVCTRDHVAWPFRFARWPAGMYTRFPLPGRSDAGARGSSRAVQAYAVACVVRCGSNQICFLHPHRSTTCHFGGLFEGAPASYSAGLRGWCG